MADGIVDGIKPCKKCGSTEKNKRGRCAPCVRYQAMEWHRKNKARVNEERRLHRLENLEEERKKARERNRKNVEKIKEYRRIKSQSPQYKAKVKEYREKNLERIKEYQDKYNKEYYQRNKDRLKALARDYLNKNREEINAKARHEYDPRKSWRKLNPEKHKRYQREYTKNNRKLRCHYEHERRARKNGSEGSLSKGIVDTLLERQKGKCACCRKPLSGEYHLDHIVPLSKGGKNQDDNVQLLLPSCNLKKSAKDPIEYMQSKGYLL